MYRPHPVTFDWFQCNQHAKTHRHGIPSSSHLTYLYAHTYTQMTHYNCILQGNQAIQRTAYVTCWHYILIITWCTAVELTQFPLHIRNHICKCWYKQTMGIWIKKVSNADRQRERELTTENTQTLPPHSHSKIGSQSDNTHTHTHTHAHTHTHTHLLVCLLPASDLTDSSSKEIGISRETGGRGDGGKEGGVEWHYVYRCG